MARFSGSDTKEILLYTHCIPLAQCTLVSFLFRGTSSVQQQQPHYSPRKLMDQIKCSWHSIICFYCLFLVFCLLRDGSGCLVFYLSCKFILLLADIFAAAKTSTQSCAK